MERLDFPWIQPALKRLPAIISAMPHALLIGGQAGLGKRTTALYLAKALLCEGERTGRGGCGNCPSCHLYAAGTHPDLRIVESGQEDAANAASSDEASVTPAKKSSRHISVDAIRALAEFVTTTPYRGRAKVIVIGPAETMHPSAANALLKMLEEPPGGATFFVLVSHRPDRLLATIRSRCFQVLLGVPTPDVALTWLHEQGIKNPHLALAQGSFAPLAAMNKAVDVEFWHQRKALLDELARPGCNPMVAADRAEPIEGPVVAMLLSQWAYDLVSLKSGGAVRYHADYAAALEALARKFTTRLFLNWYESVLEFGRSSQHPLNKRLTMESLLSTYPTL